MKGDCLLCRRSVEFRYSRTRLFRTSKVYSQHVDTQAHKALGNPTPDTTDTTRYYNCYFAFHIYNPPYCERHRRGYETRVLSPKIDVCYTVHGSARYTIETVEVSGGIV